MSRSYVAISDPVHDLVRRLTRQTPLQVAISPDGEVQICYRVSEADLPNDYYSLALLHSIGGMSLECLKRTDWEVNCADRSGVPQRVNYFDAVCLDKRCCRDLRLKKIARGPCMLSGELLAFGTGMLRACNDDPDEPLYTYLHQQHGKFSCKGEVVYARIGALHRNTRGSADVVGKETFNSTNFIYGDALGELQQLWERRADTTFLDWVAVSLSTLRAQGFVTSYLHPPKNLQGIMALHLQRQCVWKSPPASGRALLRRVEHILDNVDLRRPASAMTAKEPHPKRSRRPRRKGLDNSGYDGWLSL